MSSTPHRDDQQRSPWGTTRGEEGTPELEFFDDEYFAAPYALKSSSNARSFRGGEASRRTFEVGLSRENNGIDNAMSGGATMSSRGGGSVSPATGAGACGADVVARCWHRERWRECHDDESTSDRSERRIERHSVERHAKSYRE